MQPYLGNPYVNKSKQSDPKQKPIADSISIAQETDNGVIRNNYQKTDEILSDGYLDSDNNTPTDNGYNNKKIIIIGLVIISIIIVLVLVITLPIVLLNRKSSSSNSYACLQNSQCSGIRPEVQQYIFENYHQQNQILSIMQIAQSLQKIGNQQINSNNSVQIYKQQLQAIKCSDSIFGKDFIDHYTKLQALSLNTQDRLSNFFVMIQNSGSEPFNEQQISSCNFKTARLLTSTRLLQHDDNNDNDNDNDNDNGNDNDNDNGNDNSNNQNGSDNSHENQHSNQNQTNQNICSSTSKSVLIFINAFGYAPLAVHHSLNKLSQITDSSTTTKFNFKKYLGPGKRSSNIFLKIIWSYQSKLRSEGLSFDRVVLFRHLLLLISSNPNQLDFSISPGFIQFFLQQIQKIQINSSYHLAQIRKQINLGRKVVVIAHSFGTFIANEAYNQLSSQEKNSVSLVFIAPATNNIADNNNNYITNPSDFIINIIRNLAVRFNFSQPLDANVNNAEYDCIVFAGNNRTCLNHSLVGYLNAYRSQISTNISTALNSTIYPNNTSPLTVKLSWSSGQYQVDLHIYQPDGTHVFRNDLKGSNGNITTDSSNVSYYKTNCSSLNVGTYVVGVNYYSGNNPISGSINILAGNITFDKSLSIQSANGSQGNQNPVRICEIVVSKKEQEFKFQINLL